MSCCLILSIEDYAHFNNMKEETTQEKIYRRLGYIIFIVLLPLSIFYIPFWIFNNLKKN